MANSDTQMKRPYPPLSVAIELITSHPYMLVEDLQSKLDFLEGYLKKVSGKE
ncbi:hypothetical protein ACQL2C_004291 [Yersinia enterocolitica]